QMVEIKVGAELDRAVAEAIGVGCYLSRERDELLCLVTGAGAEDLNKLNASSLSWRDSFPFQPSVDLNAAFAAAEKVGLFTSNRAIKTNRHHWEVVELGDPLDRVVSKGDTP